MDPIDSEAARDPVETGNPQESLGNTGEAAPAADTKKTPEGEPIMPPKGLKAKDLIEAGLMESSDAEGFKQLGFHFLVLGACAFAVNRCLAAEQWAPLCLVYPVYGVTISLLFNGFHEMVHNTAFRTPALNNFFAIILGFFNFRSAMWFWCFHWTHHRYTNDPVLDPELSGGSLDLDDPTKSLWGYFSFLSGYPFGFERAWGMAKMGLGLRVDPWVENKQAKTQAKVRLEAAAYTCGYLLLAGSSLLLAAQGKPDFLKALVLYWLLPHVLGAGHLRMYQFAEHRACQMGPYTDTNAFIAARTTLTWTPYCKLAWNMPYHIEHHSWPNVPFHKLPEVHERVRKAYEAQGFEKNPSGCDPTGEAGYGQLHVTIFQRMVKNVFGGGAVEEKKQPLLAGAEP